MIVSKNWGLPFNPGIKKSVSNYCPTGCDFCVLPIATDIRATQSIVDACIGYSKDAPVLPTTAVLPGTKFSGVLIFECPFCFSKFWVHAELRMIDFITVRKKQMK